MTHDVSDGMGISRVLVVEDDPALRRAMHKILGDFDVDLAVDGAHGLEMMRASRYDMVVSDIDMPRLDGVSFMRSAVSEDLAAPEDFLFVSAMNTGDKALTLVREDFVVIRKPFTSHVLLEAVNETLTRASRMAKI